MTHVWRPFENDFEGRAEHFFFPYCLIHDSNTKKSELFSQLRETWNSFTPEKIVEHMTPYQAPFMSIDSKGEYIGHTEISLRLDRLVRLKRPSSTYPFVMALLHARKNENISDEQCLGMLDVLEAFLVRRAIVGFEPTGLHALFKGLWGELSNYSISEFKHFVSEKPTVQWPNDNELREAITTRSLAKTKICNYLLVEYDRSLPGDHPLSTPTIEHILPQSYETESRWAELFTKDQHKKLKDTWANLLPLSSPLNSSLQARPYSDKSQRYTNESMYITPRTVANQWEEWTVSSLEERRDALVNWAIERWPHSI